MHLFFTDLFTVNGKVVQNYEVQRILIFVFCPNRLHFRGIFFFQTLTILSFSLWLTDRLYLVCTNQLRCRSGGCAVRI